MRARVVDRAQRAVEVEQHDAAALDEDQLALAGRQFVNGDDRDRAAAVSAVH